MDFRSIVGLRYKHTATCSVALASQKQPGIPYCPQSEKDHLRTGLAGYINRLLQIPATRALSVQYWIIS